MASPIGKIFLPVVCIYLSFPPLAAGSMQTYKSKITKRFSEMGKSYGEFTFTVENDVLKKTTFHQTDNYKDGSFGAAFADGRLYLFISDKNPISKEKILQNEFFFFGFASSDASLSIVLDDKNRIKEILSPDHEETLLQFRFYDQKGKYVYYLQRLPREIDDELLLQLPAVTECYAAIIDSKGNIVDKRILKRHK